MRGRYELSWSEFRRIFPVHKLFSLGWNLLQNENKPSLSVMVLPRGAAGMQDPLLFMQLSKTSWTISPPAPPPILPPHHHHLRDWTSPSDSFKHVGFILVAQKKIAELWFEWWVALMFGDSGDLWCSSETSRCVAEKKYTEQQAKRHVFVPVCNPDGTYSEVKLHTTQLKLAEEWTE